ncbi:MAG: response regulator [Candidatus Latescibacteria bacterium]|nr:response regulator [Candidatus Latescibacterota bacterium]MBT4136370.1 response regulator [Candidatus Latescibacterota bacterium]MBT5830151.1 response regulator [Candidatus Latescibacterota bacterium]
MSYLYIWFLALLLWGWPGILLASGGDVPVSVEGALWYQNWFWGVMVGGIVLIVFLVRRLVLRDRKLSETYRELEVAHWDLERRVQLRTAELAEANKLLQQEMYERKQAEKELVRFERLRALSELSAGVSHNMNNLLTGILGPAELIQCVDDPEKIDSYLDMIVRSSLRMADVVNRLHLSVAIESPGEMGETSLEEAILSTIDLTRPRWKDEAESNGIAIVVETALAKTPAIYAQEQELRDVLRHLIFNAIESMADGGTIAIKTVCKDGKVILSVSDTGVGIGEDIQARIFDPFFSTKMDVGSGLGLSLVRGTLQRWGGTVAVNSEEGVGTTFTLTLPIWKEDALLREEEVARPDVIPRKRILVVDDEEVVLRIIESALQQHHDVDVAMGGKDGVALFEEKEYDLALIDLGMPYMPGDQVAKFIKEKKPEVMTLMVTGWNLDPKDERLTWFDGLMTKPFDSLNALREVVGKMAVAHEERLMGEEEGAEDRG